TSQANRPAKKVTVIGSASLDIGLLAPVDSITNKHVHSTRLGCGVILLVVADTSSVAGLTSRAHCQGIAIGGHTHGMAKSVARISIAGLDIGLLAPYAFVADKDVGRARIGCIVICLGQPASIHASGVAVFINCAYRQGIAIG